MPLASFRLNTLSRRMAAADSYFILTNTTNPFDDERSSIDVDSSRNIYLSNSFEPNMFKISETGSIIWQKTTSNMFASRNVLVDTSGNALVVGHDNSNPGSAYLLRLNSNDGSTNFSVRRQMNNFSIDSNFASWGLNSNTGTGRNALKDSAGNVYTIHFADRSGNNRINVAKFNSSGLFQSNLLFTLDSGANNVNTASWQVTSSAMDASDNLHLFCNYNYGSGVRGYIVKINTSTMAITWSFFNGDNLFAGSQGMAVDSSGNVYVRRRRWIQKINSSGSQVWQKQISIDPGNDDVSHALDVDSSGNVYVAFIVSNKNHILKLDTNGNIIFSRSFSTNNSNSGNTGLIIRNNSIYLSGRGQVSGTTNGMFIAKLPLDGTLTGTYNSTLVYQNESVTLSNAGPFSQTSVNNTVNSVSMTNVTFNPTVTNTTRTSFTPITI
jgi:hypothetical protein